MTDRSAFTAGLRAVAGFLDEHPEVPLPYLGAFAEGSDLPCLPIYLTGLDDQRGQLATITRAMGKATKAAKDYHDGGGDAFQVWRAFEGVVLMANASRDEVCTRVVTGTEDREVEEVVTPAVTRKVVKPVEVVAWECLPLLAPTASEMADAAVEHDPDGVADALAGGVLGEPTAERAALVTPPETCDHGVPAPCGICHADASTDNLEDAAPDVAQAAGIPQAEGTCRRCGAKAGTGIDGGVPLLVDDDGLRCHNAKRCAGRQAAKASTR